eukprot:CAMPEP_0172466968 /NCGR_PEP_ID=MMETSP1065-20121228/57588_1 /TAXON_ID=265537 /ORGANISM="Amphiprora paludosa, Strain CCMP125" /LENGTH=1115 /DNA_ID=CAMNT_0013223959 /DNA_START=84 /DNA_END=3431 /DNA_ORIENTATION=+
MVRMWGGSNPAADGSEALIGTTVVTSTTTSTLATSSTAPEGTNATTTANSSSSWLSWGTRNASSTTTPVSVESSIPTQAQSSWYSLPSWNNRSSTPTPPSNLPAIDSSSTTQPWYSFSWTGTSGATPVTEKAPSTSAANTPSWYSFSWSGTKSGGPPQTIDTSNNNTQQQQSSSWFSYSYDSSGNGGNGDGYTGTSLASVVSSLYRYGGMEDHDNDGRHRLVSGSESSNSPTWGDGETPSLIMTLQKQNRRRERKRRRNLGGTRSSPFDLSIFQNPYHSVRGLQPDQQASMTALRNFLTLVPDVNQYGYNNNGYHMDYETTSEDHDPSQEPQQDAFNPQFPAAILGGPLGNSGVEGDISMTDGSTKVVHETELQGEYGVPTREPTLGEHQHPPLHQHGMDESWSDRQQRQAESSRADAAAETAAHLAEGTLRAWRDLSLEEAVELNDALRFWSSRWERPLLSWLEAGPEVWATTGYNHRRVGKRVAQIQAVLARRCAAIGELQQHLLRAGWQKGVAQWGVLGQGGHWATVAGFDGSIKPGDELIPHAPTERHLYDDDDETDEEAPIIEPTVHRVSPASSHLLRGMSDRKLRISQVLSAGELPEIEAVPEDGPLEIPDLPHGDSRIGGALSNSHENMKKTDGADVFVKKRDGGGTFVDDPAYLGQWSVDAIALVRQQLFRASNGTVGLPYASNWVLDDVVGRNEEQEDENMIVPPGQEPKTVLPLWAVDTGSYWAESGSKGGGGSVEDEEEGTELPPQKQNVMIGDLPMMSEEVEELLYIMEEMMEIQRERRLDRLRPPSWWRRNWYVLATSVPLSVWLVRHGRLRYLISSIIRSVKFFIVERIQGPMSAIFEEIWKGRASFSDKKARTETMEVLKKMIKSWLDDCYPSMTEEARQVMADAMDVSLVERRKEESMKSVFETFDVVRMSFIEMQWLKKEMMNALDAMDEVMSANDINMNIAAITPVGMIVYGVGRVMKYLVYGLMRLGRSREETYAYFRTTLLDIERLLVMRDNPPDARTMTTDATPCVLGSDDLGMLMLLIHECRTILWRDRRRFAPNLIRGVSEDLAELAGERGAVSVKQQLLIISRMSRSYPFLKVISTGHFLEHSQIKTDGWL